MTMQKLDVVEVSKFWKPTNQDNIREGEYVRMEAPKSGKEKFGSSFVLLDSTGAEVMLPNHETIAAGMRMLKVGEYVKVTFTGKKGNKYTYSFEHDPEYKRQTKLDEPKSNDAQIIKMQKLKEELTRTAKLWPDGIIPEAGVKAEIQRIYNPGEQTEEMFRLLKYEGWLAYVGNGLRVVV